MCYKKSENDILRLPLQNLILIFVFINSVMGNYCYKSLKERDLTRTKL